MKQTAVEWLAQQLEKGLIGDNAWYDVLDKAKAMEKEQIATAFGEGIFSVNKTGKQYYNETFKSE